jgi:mono/diheme cytochrome c family protein
MDEPGPARTILRRDILQNRQSIRRKRMNRRSLLSWSFAALLAGGAIVAVLPQRARAADAKGVEFFESKIRPILANNCVGCHGTEKQKGGLRLDTREHMLAGGKDDNDKPLPVFVPADPGKSLIIEAVEYKNEDLQMPPPKKGKSMKLPDADIAAIKDWIKMGAPYGEKPVEAVKGADKGADK